MRACRRRGAPPADAARASGGMPAELRAAARASARPMFRIPPDAPAHDAPDRRHREAARRRDGRGAEGRSDHAAAAAVRRRGDRRGQGSSRSSRRATAASRSRSRSRSRTRSCRPRPRRRRRPSERAPRRPRCCAGKLVELGTRAPVAGATVTARSSASARTRSTPIRRATFELAAAARARRRSS